MKKGILFAVMMVLMLASRINAQSFSSNAQSIDFNINTIDLFTERIFFIYNLYNDSRFSVTIGEENGVFIVNANESFETMDLEDAFSDFQQTTSRDFNFLSKEDAAVYCEEYKAKLSKEAINHLMMDYYIQSRQNNYCATADPFCTDNGLYQFPAGVNAGSGESGPDYNCLSTRPNPAWYYMQIDNPGNMNIYMYSTPSKDIDFCCWGPFNDPITPCPNQLTASKVVSCSYSANATETCVIPATAQHNDYFILVITNFSNAQCNISFSKQSGTGTTNCGILPPLVNNDGPYCVGETIRLSGNAQAGATYSWSGPGGWSATGQNVTRPNCTMAMAGTYTCTITVGNQTNSATTDVSVIAQPHANFTASTVCRGEPTHFDASNSTTSPSGYNITSYTWSFGDNTPTGHGRTIDHTYANPGTYTVRLTTNIESGENLCSDTKTQQVTVYSLPQPICGANPNPVAYGQTATLTANAGAGNISYHWEPANKVTNANSATTTTIPLTENTTFTCTATNSQGGCSANGTVRVTINGSQMEAEATADYTTICQGFTTTLNAIASGGTGNFSYSWSPANLVVNPTSATTATRELTQSTTFTCTVTDAAVGSTNVNVSINVLPKKEFDEHHFICPGDDFDWSVNGEHYGHPGEGYLANYVYNDYPLPNVCDSTVNLYIDYYPTYNYIIHDTICQGESYYAHGFYQPNPTLTSYPGIFTDENRCITAEGGCDSIVHLELWIRNSINDTIEGSVCKSSTYYFNEEYPALTDEGYYYYHGFTSLGCDSIVTLYLTQDDYLKEDFLNEMTCNEPYHWRDIIYYPIDGQVAHYTRTDTIISTNPDICDSIKRLDLTIYPTFAPTIIDTTVCDEFYWNWPGFVHDSTFTRSTYYEVQGQSQYNSRCDSTVILKLTVNSSYDIMAEPVFGCDTVVWDVPEQNNFNHIFSELGTHSYTTPVPFISSQNCDSTVTWTVTIEKTPSFEKVIGNPWVVGGSQLHYTLEQYRIWPIPSTPHYDTEWKMLDKNGNNFQKWTLFPVGNNNESVMVAIFTFEMDSVQLIATTRNAHEHTSVCSNGQLSDTIWIHCTYADVLEYADLQNVEIQPNPNNGTMNITFENMRGDVQIKVLSINGILVDEFNVHNNVDTVIYPYSTHDLSDGLYFFVIANDNKVITKKVVIIQ